MVPFKVSSSTLALRLFHMAKFSLQKEDGRVFEVDRLIDIRQAASLKGGGVGIRYTCNIMGKQVYLYDDEGKWFIERK